MIMTHVDRYLLPAADCTVDYNHPALGQPSHVWPYHNANCDLLGFICRFDTADGKEILPRTLWSTSRAPDGEWMWRGFPEPRPLYGLDKLDARYDAPVLICEGEKAADAAERLYPAYVCITSPGGSNAAHKADWSALKNCIVVIWPDNDEAGQKYAQAVATILRPIATSVGIITPPEGVKKGWDAADALAEGWDESRLQALLATATSATPATPPDDKSSNRSDCSSSSWAEPISLMQDGFVSNPYPVDALPPLIKNAVVSYQKYGQQPMALVATSALANVSIACQGLADVARDSQLIGPLSLSFIIIAESGERKSATDKKFTEAALKWEANKIIESKAEVARSKARIEAHKAKQIGVQKQISKLSVDFIKNRSKIEELEKQMEEAEVQAPKAVITPNLFYEDTSHEQLAIKLSEAWPSAALYSDEAAIVVGGYSMKEENALGFFGFLNRVWDGNPYRRQRVSAPSCHGIGRRLTFSLMMQEHVIRTLLKVSDGQSRNTGFMARILLAYPESTMGTREYRESEDFDPYMNAFHRRITMLLDEPLPTKDDTMQLTPPVLEMDAEAHALWVEYYNRTERQLGKLGDYAMIKDFAAKSAENAARLAGLFHVFERGVVGRIDAEMMQRGTIIAAWHLEETKRIFNYLEEPQNILDAKLLQEWLFKRGEREFTAREIMQFGPNILRKDQNRRTRALETLAAHHIIATQTKGSRTIYLINPILM